MNDRPMPSPQQHQERLDDPVELPRTSAEEAAESGGWAPPQSGLKTTIILAGVILVGVFVILYAWGLPPFTRTVQTTDNAYVRAQTTVIAPQVNGYVTQVLVDDFARVKAGDPLVVIDRRIYDQRVQQAHASVQEAVANLRNSEQSERASTAAVAGRKAGVNSAEAQLARAEADLNRVTDLVERGSISLRERDQLVAALRAAEAGVEQARAELAIAEEQERTVSVNRGALLAAVENARASLRLAEIDLANTTIRAPRDGQVSEIGVRLGQYVTAGTQLLYLVPFDMWVIANFKEAQIARMAPGQRAEVSVDALDGATLTGHVEQIAPAAGNEFSVIRPDNATGNFVKIAQRIAVRIGFDPDQQLVSRLRPGMSVEARVDTASTPAPTPPPDAEAGHP